MRQLARLALGLVVVTVDPAIAVAANYATQFTYDASGNTRTARTYDLDTDARNCGSFGRVCGGLASDCNAGYCGMWTSTGTFIDPLTDSSNCGGADHVCDDAPENGYPTCDMGTCAFECCAPYEHGIDACVDTTTDPYNCGAVGNACDGAWAGTAACVYAVCRSVENTVPVVEAVNGVAPGGTLFRTARWKEIVVSGRGLENVTYIEIEQGGEDAEPDVYDEEAEQWIPGAPTVPFFVSWLDNPDPWSQRSTDVGGVHAQDRKGRFEPWSARSADACRGHGSSRRTSGAKRRRAA